MHGRMADREHLLLNPLIDPTHTQKDRVRVKQLCTRTTYKINKLYRQITSKDKQIDNLLLFKNTENHLQRRKKIQYNK